MWPGICGELSIEPEVVGLRGMAHAKAAKVGKGALLFIAREWAGLAGAPIGIGVNVLVSGQWGDNSFRSNSHLSAKRVALLGSRFKSRRFKDLYA